MYKQTFPAPRGHTKPAPYFVQGTTPVFSYTVTGDDGAPVSLSSAKKIEVTFSQGGSYSADEKKLTVEIDPASVTGGVIQFKLTQEQTLTFDPGTVQMQIRVLDSDGDAWATLADEIEVTVHKLLDGGVIE